MADSNFLSSVLNYGKSFAQGASNGIAGNVSAPVDGLAWLLRRAGVPVPSNPVGGSDWMNQQGLTQQPRQPLVGMLGEAAGMAGPMVAAAKAPQIAGGLLRMGENAMVPRTMNPQAGAVVWHGSPHKFNAFDSSKIGTGEGAQAYGHGLYLADNKAVAGEYAKNIMGPTATPDNIALKVMNAGNDPVQRLKQIFPKMTDAEINDAIQSAKGYQGNTYKVDLPDEHIAKMLDWDKPLNQQHSDVKAALGVGDGYFSLPLSDGNKLFAHGQSMTGADLHTEISSLMGEKTKDAAAQFLKSKGIPGIRYLDGGSRATGGTSNYVVFPGNEHLLNIQERNGVPLSSLLNK